MVENEACGRDGEDGFSLIEALVALLVLGISTAGLLQAAEAHIDTIRGLELRTAAQWVAENRLVEQGLLRAAPASGTQRVAMLGSEWLVNTTSSSSVDPDLRQVVIAVRAAGASTPTVTLRGFVDAGTTTP